MSKKLVTFLLVLAMVFTLCGACGAKTQDTAQTAENTQTVENAQNTQASGKDEAEASETRAQDKDTTALKADKKSTQETESTEKTTEKSTEEDTQNAAKPQSEPETETPAVVPEPPVKQVIVCIDPGHGGDGDRNHGVEREYDGTMIMEKTLTLALAQKVQWYLEQQPGVTAVLTRTDDYALGISDRVNCAATNNADFLVSLHINSSSTGNPDDHGCLAIVTQSHYQAKNAKSANVYGSSEALASNILVNLNGLGIPFTSDFAANTTGGLLRRASESGAAYADGSAADYYGIISHATKAGIPACIVEHAFLSSESDYYNYLSDDAKLNALAQADANGILTYINCY